MIVITGLLVFPMMLMAPEDQASDNPGGPVYDLENRYNTNLPPRIHGAFFVVEARNGDILTKAPLLELLENSEKLRKADISGQLSPPNLPTQSYLYNGFNIDRQQPRVGIFTIANAVDEVMRNHPDLNTTLVDASENQVKLALNYVFNDTRTSFLLNSISRQKTVVSDQKFDIWSSPAVTFGVAADNEKLGGGSLRIGTTSDQATVDKEHFNRKVQELLRGNQETYQLWGMAIDASLELEDEVGTAIPFIIATFLAVLVIVGISLKSSWVVLLTAIGLGAMIVWLKGLSNLIGLNSSTTLEFIVPIAMISLGADFIIHAVNRYREERGLGLDPRAALKIGMAGVLGALTLAMFTDAIAFVANASADIETVVGFGIGASLAIFAAFMIMGLTMPIALMRIDAFRAKLAKQQITISKHIEYPPLVHSRWSIPNIVLFLANRRLIVLPIVLIATLISSYYATRLDATFDVKDFFKSDSDFAIGLDKMDLHIGDSAGESAIIYLEGDLTQPKALKAISTFIDNAGDNPYVAKNNNGGASIQARTLFNILDQVMRSGYAREQIANSTGIEISDKNPGKFEYENRVYIWPTNHEQLGAIYEYIYRYGVPLTSKQMAYDRLEVGETLFHDPTGIKPDATAIVLGIPGTREQKKVIRSKETLERDIEILRQTSGISLVGLTGSPYTRQASLDATTDGLQEALGIAIVLCLIITIFAMRSILLGVVTIIPIALVVIWIYAFMYAFGFGLNFITATIAAVSIGIGIDYAIHMTQRFREELSRSRNKEEALRKAAAGTGIALIASAVSSIIGFGIMGFAPMPMFSSYGILTATMILMAAVASLLVLPSLLLLVTRDLSETSIVGDTDAPKE